MIVPSFPTLLILLKLYFSNLKWIALIKFGNSKNRDDSEKSIRNNYIIYILKDHQHLKMCYKKCAQNTNIISNSTT